MNRLEREQLIAVTDLSEAGTVPATPDRIASQCHVRLFFSLALASGEVIDSNFGRAPADCRIGDGNLPLAFERHLLGLRVGDECDVLLEAEEAFGPLRSENLQRVPRFRFPADLPLACGLVVDFTDQAGNTQAGVVRTFDSSTVEVDFNHPLAGRALRFRARIVAVSASPFARSAGEAESPRTHEP